RAEHHEAPRREDGFDAFDEAAHGLVALEEVRDAMTQDGVEATQRSREVLEAPDLEALGREPLVREAREGLLVPFGRRVHADQPAATANQERKVTAVPEADVE